MSGEPLTWEELVDECSRIHTTRRRPEGPWPDAALRENSRSLEVLIKDVPARVVPTRMHEPGFYYWVGQEPRRSEADLLILQAAVELGEVVRA